MLVLVYDCSLNGDWVAHYAAYTAERRLRLVHVQDGAPPHLPERIERIAELGVTLEPDVASRRARESPSGCSSSSPPDPKRLDLRHAGAPAEPRIPRGDGVGAASRAGRFRVIALRVVHPGILGQPDRVLLPLADRPRTVAHALPPLRLLGSDLHHLRVLFVREASRLALPAPSHEALEQRLAQGRSFVERMEEEVRVALAPHRVAIDGTSSSRMTPLGRSWSRPASTECV